MEVILFFQSFASPTLDAFVQLISDLGSVEAYIVVLLVVYLGFDSTTGQRAGTYLLLSLLLNFYLKGWIATDRPFVAEPELNRSDETELGYAFPSGHTQGATTLWGYLAARVDRGRFWVAASALVLTVALTRLYLGVHWPLDVLGGLLIGAGVVLMALELDRRLPALRRTVRVPVVLRVAIALLLPLTLAVAAPPPGSESSLMFGALSAFLTAPTVLRFRTGGAWWRRTLLVVLGLVLVFAVLLGSSVLLPEEVKRSAAGGWLRYLVLGWTGLIVAPWLGGLLHLSPHVAFRRHRP